jgi:hypothetical protein
MTVLEAVFPFLDLTVTVTLQDPALRPLSAVPVTLQTLEELAATFRDTFEVETTFSFAYAAKDFADADLEVVNRGEATNGDTALPSKSHEVLLPALSETRILRLPRANFLTEAELTPKPTSEAFTRTVVA